METDQLIRTLAADNAERARPVGFVLTLALVAAAPVSVLMFVATWYTIATALVAAIGALAGSRLLRF